MDANVTIPQRARNKLRTAHYVQCTNEWCKALYILVTDIAITVESNNLIVASKHKLMREWSYGVTPYLWRLMREEKEWPED